MSKWVRLILAGLLPAAPLFISGCGGAPLGDSSMQILKTEEAKQLLLQLPYRYHLRPVALPEGASGALAGSAIGQHRTIVHFGVALGRDSGLVSVPHAGTSGAYGYPDGGFMFTDDLQVRGKHHTWHRGSQFRTAAQWDEATTMVVKMQEKLCKAATGEPCPP